MPYTRIVDCFMDSQDSLEAFAQAHAKDSRSGQVSSNNVPASVWRDGENPTNSCRREFAQCISGGLYE